MTTSVHAVTPQILSLGRAELLGWLHLCSWGTETRSRIFPHQYPLSSAHPAGSSNTASFSSGSQQPAQVHSLSEVLRLEYIKVPQ